MRLFIAVDLDDTARQALQQRSVALRQRLERLKGATRLTWVSPERLHLTLMFIGEVPDDRGSEIAARLGAPMSLDPFVLEFGRFGTFPQVGRPRVIWVEVTKGHDELKAVHAQALARLEGIEFEREARPFSPHLTLARFREPGTSTERQILADAPASAPVSSPVQHLTLYQSRLSPKGPTYTVLRRTPLGKAAR